MTVSVTFGPLFSGRSFSNFCRRPEYVTIRIIAATVVRELAVSVTFGALRAGSSLTPCRRPRFTQTTDLARAKRFGQHTLVFCHVVCCCRDIWPRHGMWHVVPPRLFYSMASWCCIEFGSGVVACNRHLRCRVRLLSVACS